MSEADVELAKMGEAVVAPLSSIRAVDDMDTAEFLAWLESEGTTLEEFDGGSQWELLKDKSELVDEPFIIAKVRFNEKNGVFASVCCFLDGGRKIIFNDGGTGVYKQLKTYVERHGRDTGIVCAKGLRLSGPYAYTDSNGVEHTDGYTYYIA